MSIGEVLAHLRVNFPDVTISKIRFLEVKGIVRPARTASGYRLFSQEDIERLRFVLTAQRDPYVPLAAIKQRLDALDHARQQPSREGSVTEVSVMRFSADAGRTTGNPDAAAANSGDAFHLIEGTIDPRTLTAVAGLLADADPAEVERVVAVTNAPEEPLEPALWGSAPSRGEVATGVLALLRQQFEGRRELEHASVSPAQAAELLGTSAQAVTDQLEAGRLLGFKRGRRWAIPAWQFDAEAERGFLPGLDALAAAFPGGVVALSAWATRPSPDLAGRRPRDELAAGRLEPVLQLARSLTAAGW